MYTCTWYTCICLAETWIWSLLPSDPWAPALHLLRLFSESRWTIFCQELMIKAGSEAGSEWLSCKVRQFRSSQNIKQRNHSHLHNHLAPPNPPPPPPPPPQVQYLCRDACGSGEAGCHLPHISCNQCHCRALVFLHVTDKIIPEVQQLHDCFSTEQLISAVRPLTSHWRPWSGSSCKGVCFGQQPPPKILWPLLKMWCY